MSRYKTVVKRGRQIDREAVIGYDPPLRTFFLYAFLDPETDEPEIDLGNRPEEFTDLHELERAVSACGCTLSALTSILVSNLVRDRARGY